MTGFLFRPSCFTGGSYRWNSGTSDTGSDPWWWPRGHAKTPDRNQGQGMLTRASDAATNTLHCAQKERVRGAGS